MKKHLVIFLLTASVLSAEAQDKPQFTGTQFWAMTVSDVAATSK